VRQEYVTEEPEAGGDEGDDAREFQPERNVVWRADGRHTGAI
jgi:hypothetical protein